MTNSVQWHIDNVNTTTQIVSLITADRNHAEAMYIVIMVIDVMARMSGQREEFWSGMWDLVDAAMEQLETSPSVH